MNGPRRADSIRKKGYVARPFRAGDEHGIQALFNLIWPAAGLPARDLAMWRWQFADWPWGHRIFVAEDDAGRIIAHYCGVPVPLAVAGAPATGSVCTDSMVHPDARRGLQREGPFLTVARAYYEAWGNTAANYWNWGFSNRVARPVAAPELEVRRVARFDGAAVDALWRGCRADYPLATVRDGVYLNWRYADCPRELALLEVRERGALRGVAVLRDRWMGQPIVGVFDYLAAVDDDACLSAVLEHAVAHARGTGHGRVELWLPQHSRPFRTALAVGYDTQRSGIIIVCVLPPACRRGVDWHRDHWYFTIGDSDIY